jgi:uncharacterized small protein (DUF1192 family)
VHLLQALHEEELAAAAANLASVQSEVERTQASLAEKAAELSAAEEQGASFKQQLTELEAAHGENHILSGSSELR